MKHNYILTSPEIKNAENLTKIQKSFLDKLTEIITANITLSSFQEYNVFIRELVTLAKKQYRVQIITSLYDKEISLIENNKPLTEKTLWGGVILKKVNVEKDFIQKLLVIKPYGVLGFEIHERKQEKLEVREGVCLIFHVDHTKNNKEINLYLAKKGDTFSFAPRDEHGVLALTEAVLQETSTNHLDDLVYIFKASQIM